jgi:hypothetical protein
MQNRTNKVLEDDSYLPIYCLYLDPIELIEHYVSGNKLKSLINCLLCSS